ncbi:hypothetical protein [Bacillus thuringiensis]|uniref:CpXC domain-containing protein n=1 Tax=Bacillus thuringiensis TaxID=1428 RepID=A0A9X7GFV0_BACTU|nr:hypothetical protein [Bacillus thuringiensis]PFV35717.1 hypothetical protein COK99_01470 [Bacillus thuringiensis]
MSLVMKEPTYRNKSVICSCGNKIETYFEDAISDALYESTSFEDELKESETVLCNRCGTKHELTLKVERTIAVTYSSVTPIGMAYMDINNEIYAAEKLGDLLTGDEVPLLDGRYVSVPHEYHVKDGKIEHIYNVLIDENQLDLFEEKNL